MTLGRTIPLPAPDALLKRERGAAGGGAQRQNEGDFQNTAVFQ
jgi:hypothetical protein